MAITLRLEEKETKQLLAISRAIGSATQSGTITKMIKEYADKDEKILALEKEVMRLKATLDGLSSAADSFKQVLAYLDPTPAKKPSSKKATTKKTASKKPAAKKTIRKRPVKVKPKTIAK